MPALLHKPQFLRPISDGRFPFDDVARRIVDALEARNWNVPGVEVEFDTYGSGASQHRLVRKIQTPDARMRFGRTQRRLPGGDWNDTAGLDQINIPEEEIHVYDDNSGPTYYRYAGTDWGADREAFETWGKVNSKLNGRKLLYYKFKAVCRCGPAEDAAYEATSAIGALLSGGRGALRALPHTHRGDRSPLLVPDDDLGREYVSDDYEEFLTDEVLNAFTKYLEENVLPLILAQPVATEPHAFPKPEAIPFPTDFGDIFTFCEWRDADRIRKGQLERLLLDPDDHYGLAPHGYRLVALGDGDGNVPDIAYEGFKWCGIFEPMVATKLTRERGMRRSIPKRRGFRPFSSLGSGALEYWLKRCHRAKRKPILNVKDAHIRDLEIPGHYCWRDREQHVVRVKPKTANDIYVADQAVYEEARAKTNARCEAEKRTQYTNDEMRHHMSVRGRSIVPIHLYKGDYKKPIVLVGRELDFDEVELVSGPWERES